jgi:hypothetical protein
VSAATRTRGLPTAPAPRYPRGALSAFTDVLHEMGRAEEPLSLAALTDRLAREPHDVIAAIGVLESQGLVLRVHTRFGLSKLGRRSARVTTAVG